MTVKRILIILSLMALVLHPISAHAASPYDGPPADLKAFENKLLASIATISCTYKKGIGFLDLTPYRRTQKTKVIIH